MQYQDLFLQDYVYRFLKKINLNYFFRDKRILFLYLDSTIDYAKFFLKFDAKWVYFANPLFSFQKLENFDITKLNFFEISKIPDNSVDMVIGLEILEHIRDFGNFVFHLNRITTKDAHIELQGSPMWTSPNGHHIWLPKYKFNEISNPFKPWEHLIYNDKYEIKNALLSKGYDENDSKEISDWIYNDNEINRISPNIVIKYFINNPSETEYKNKFIDRMPVLYKQCMENGCEYKITHYLCDETKNDYYEIAKQKFSETELITSALNISINKNVYFE